MSHRNYPSPDDESRENETYRAAIYARRPTALGGGACNLLVRRVDGRVQLLHHAALSTGAELTDAQAVELADCLTPAAGMRRGHPDDR
jgi:hypothetical protein